MATYTDLEGRNISQGVYDAHIKAGKDVSGYKTQSTPTDVVATAASDIPVDTSATDVKNQAPTSANIENARKNFESMDYQKQQDFLSKNKSFDVNKYGFKLASKPEQIQPQGEVVVEDKKVDQNKIDTPERLQEIQTNLEGYYQTSKDLFKDEDTFNKFFQLDNRSQAQKDVLTKFYNNRKSERDLAALPTQQIASGLVNGLYTEDQLEFLKLSDPARYTEIQQAKIKESQKLTNQATLFAIAKQFGLGGDDDKNGTLDFMEKTIETPDITQTPEEKAANEQLNSLSNEIDDMQTTINGVEKELSKKYGGSVTKSQLAALVRDQTNGLIEDRNAKITEAKLLQGKIANFTAARELELKQYELDQNAFNQKLNLFNQAYGMYSGERAYDLQLQQLESGKFTTTPDPLGRGYIITNSKTGETTLKTFEEMGGSTSSGGGTFNPPSDSTMRTDRHNNPTAMTIDVAKQGGLIEGVDYEKGDPFKGANGQTYYTARLLGDALDSTRKVIDKIGFTTAKGNPRRSYLSDLGVTNDSWSKMSDSEKNGIIAKMYKHEGGKGTIDFGGESNTPTNQGFDPSKSDLYKAYLKDGKTIPDIKTLTNLGIKGADEFIKQAKAYESSIQTSSGSNPYLNAIKNIKGLSKFDKEQSLTDIQDYIDQGDTENAKVLVINALKKASGVDAAKYYELPSQTIPVLEKLSTALDNYKAKGGNMNIFNGKWENLMKRVGTVKDPELRAFANRVAVSMQQYRLKMTGAAFSPEESSEYEALFPYMSNDINLNKANIEGTIEGLRDNQQAYLQSALGTSNYNAIFGGEETKQDTSSSSSYFDTNKAMEDVSQPRANTLKDLGINL